jgi:hypothetical protein
MFTTRAPLPNDSPRTPPVASRLPARGRCRSSCAIARVTNTTGCRRDRGHGKEGVETTLYAESPRLLQASGTNTWRFRASFRSRRPRSPSCRQFRHQPEWYSNRRYDACRRRSQQADRRGVRRCRRGRAGDAGRPSGAAAYFYVNKHLVKPWCGAGPTTPRRLTLRSAARAAVLRIASHYSPDPPQLSPAPPPCDDPRTGTVAAEHP